MLALLNPMTILPYLAAASGVAERVPLGSRGSLFAVAGVVLGAMAWYLALSSATALLCRRISGSMAARLNRAAGGVLHGVSGWHRGRVALGVSCRWFRVDEPRLTARACSTWAPPIGGISAKGV